MKPKNLQEVKPTVFRETENTYAPPPPQQLKTLLLFSRPIDDDYSIIRRTKYQED